VTALPPAGWFPDPDSGGTTWRWWDGAQWAPPGYGYATYDPAAHARELALRAESTRRIGRWFRGAIALLGLTLLSSSIGIGFVFHDTIQGSTPGTDQGTPRGFIVFGLFWMLFGVCSWAYTGLFIAWLYQAGKYADLQRWPARRSRTLGAFSVLIPVLQYWWPYEAICDIYPPGARPDVALWWFVAQIVVVPVTTIIVGLTALIAPAVVAGAALVVSAALLGTTVVLGWRLIDDLDAMQRAHVPVAV
jgi:hypothetical protein